MTPNSDDLDRRDALKLIAGGLGLAALGGTAACAHTVRAASVEPRHHSGPAPERFVAAPPMDTVRIGFVGVGGVGGAHEIGRASWRGRVEISGVGVSFKKKKKEGRSMET